MENLVDPAVWRDRTVLVTGHTGFKGTWLSLWLNAMGARVVGLALEPDTERSLFEDTRAGELMSSHIGDIGDYDRVNKLVDQTRPDTVIHLAAQALVRPSYDDPVETYRTNVLGTVHLLEAIRHCDSVEAAVIVTTDKCYENREWLRGYREDDALGGKDPYSSSKACVELLVASFRDSFFAGGDADGRDRTAIATARAGNVIGGGDWATDRLVPDLIKAFHAGEVVSIRNPGSTRPWQHVLDVLAGYLMLAERLLSADAQEYTGAWNFGPAPSSSTDVATLVTKIADSWGEGSAWKLDDRPAPHEAGRLSLDPAKANQLLGWQPRHSLEHALEATVSWYKSYFEQGRDAARQLVLGQLAEFERT
jgi:CDP-glucose 4,6-dehydratase